MSTEQKVSLVAAVRSEYGLAPALAALELAKSSWYYHQQQKVSYEQKYAHLRPELEAIAQGHPDYGYRRTTVELNARIEPTVNRKVVQRLHQMWDFKLRRNVRPPKPSRLRQVITQAGERANLVAQLETIGLFEVVYTDFTELGYADGRRKAYLMPIIGHLSKFVFGWAVGPQANTDLALTAWAQAKVTFAQLAVDYAGLIMHHDQDAVYTSHAWLDQLLLKDKVRPSYALAGAKDNPAMESFNGRFKGENARLFLEAQTLTDLQLLVAERITYYNTDRRHSSLGYLSPLAFIRQRRGRC